MREVQSTARQDDHTPIQSLDDDIIRRMRMDTRTRFTDGQVFVSLNIQAGKNGGIVLTQPYLLESGRVLFIVAGRAQVILNFNRINLEAGMCAVLSPGVIFEIDTVSDNLQMEALSYLPIREDASWEPFFVLHLIRQEQSLVYSYFRTIWLESDSALYDSGILRHLQSALLLRLSKLQLRDVQSPAHLNGRSPASRIFGDFMHLLYRDGKREHFIGYYAERLGYSPNYLSSVVRKMSGSTCRELIELYLVTQAKILLQYTDQRSAEIAEELCFATPSDFSKFFHRKTGISPLHYRAAHKQSMGESSKEANVTP